MSIRSLSDMRREDEKDPNKKTTSSFTGGERSGLAVENPYDGDDENAEVLAPNNPLGGYAHVVRGRAPPGARRVTIYKNGFLLDGGSFRSLDDPENVRFLEELKAGFAPRELQQEGGRQVHVELVNEHTEIYTPPPPPAYVLFSGEGQTLNSNSGGSGSTSAATSAAGAVDVTRGEVTVQEDLPTTTIQFRFHDGQRRAQRFNESHTIADLRAFVSQVAPVDGEFRLLEGFPPKEITLDPSTTLKDAGLLNATIVQKL